jgi:hypothetical protein
MDILDEIKDDYEKADALVNVLIDRATDGVTREDDYFCLRAYFVQHTRLASKVPSWLPPQRSLNQFWHFIKPKFAKWAERREFLWNEFEPLLAACEAKENLAAEDTISDVLTNFDSLTIGRTWRNMINRVSDDPEGAITTARTLLESVCKHILDSKNVDYDGSSIELPDLYKKTAKELNLSPDQHSEQVFKQILGSCSGVVSGLGAMRNKLGDAHGKGRSNIRPEGRHARLAVNLSGATAQFLIETFNHLENKRSNQS